MEPQESSYLLTASVATTLTVPSFHMWPFAGNQSWSLVIKDSNFKVELSKPETQHALHVSVQEVIFPPFDLSGTVASGHRVSYTCFHRSAETATTVGEQALTLETSDLVINSVNLSFR